MATQAPDAVATATSHAHQTLTDLEGLLRGLSDADLHRAEPDGGWTCAQVVSHIHLCGLLWIADVERLRRTPEERVFWFREEIGHDALGAPPPSSGEAADRIASLRAALDACMPATEPELLDKTLEIPTLGTYTVADFLPIITGHLAMHVDQIRNILRSRGIPFAGDSRTSSPG